MKTNIPDRIFGQASREHLSSLCDQLFRSFLNSLIEYKLDDNIDDLIFMLSEVERSPRGDLGVSLNRFTVARFFAPRDKPLLLRPRQYIKKLRPFEPKAAAAWGEICSLCSLLLEYRNSHQHQPDASSTPTRELLLVGAVTRLHELASDLLVSESDVVDADLMPYRTLFDEALASYEEEDQGARRSISDASEAKSKVSGEAERESNAQESSVPSILARIHEEGIKRLLMALFGEYSDPVFSFQDAVNGENSDVLIPVATSLAQIGEPERQALLEYFFEDGELDEAFDEEEMLRGLRQLRHPERSERLRTLMVFDD